MMNAENPSIRSEVKLQGSSQKIAQNERLHAKLADHFDSTAL